jgi:MSHA biogenesis protein MshM
MYEQFFGLEEKPFSLTPDTEYYYRFSGHQEALNVLLVALRNGEGFVRIIGEVGTGKTLLCRQVLNVLQNDCATVYIPNPLLTPRELYQAIVSELKLEVPEDATLQHLNQRIFKELIRLREMERPLVVLIDEAQAMPLQSLEALRLLSNLETEKEKLLHIFFFAQPEFERRLSQPELRQLRQRITYSYNLPALRQQEVAGYIEHRLQVAGYQGRSIFRPAAVRKLHKASQGVPRLINLLAHKSLLAAFGKSRQQIDKGLVAAAIKDTRGEKVLATRTWQSVVAIEVGAVTVVILVIVLFLRLLL